jgi:DNA-binding MarR family transcriptional regulator
MKLLLDKLKIMKTWYDENKSKITFFEDSDLFMNKTWAEYKREYDGLIAADKNIMGSIIRRAAGNLHKLIILYAASNMKDFISMKDMQQCFDLFKISIDSIKSILGKQEMGRKQDFVILNLLREGEKSSMNVHRDIEQNLGIKSPNTKTKLIKKLKNMEYIYERKEGNNVYLSLTEKGREQLTDE